MAAGTRNSFRKAQPGRAQKAGKEDYMRVYDLAKQRGLQSKDVMDVCHNLNIEVKTPSSSIDDKNVRRILEQLDSKPKSAQPAKSDAPAAAKAAEPKKAVAAAPKASVAPRATAAPQTAPVKEPEAHKDARALALERIARAKAARRHQMEDHPAEAAAPEVKPEPTAPQHQEISLAAKP
ncbi:TPA: hypothetical protein DDW35_09920, partial [Candidatus Sumerlaeota bacterium]|nr:hypothetical protein [Candidatus Sumerlaeota bacterium]